MSCFGNLAPGAAEVQMPNESNSGVVIHPKSKHERSSALRVSALARAPARIGLEFTSRTSLARSSNSCRIAAHDEVTTIDNALTRPWTVTKNYHRVRNPVWVEAICAEGNQHVRIGTESYMLSADGYLMPAKKDQPPPDLRYFKQTGK
jgi:hypothetical protein